MLFEQSFHFSHSDVSFKHPFLQFDFQFSSHQNCCIICFPPSNTWPSSKAPLKLHLLGNNFFNCPTPWKSLSNSSMPLLAVILSFLEILFVCVFLCLRQCLVSYVTDANPLRPRTWPSIFCFNFLQCFPKSYANNM